MVGVVGGIVFAAEGGRRWRRSFRRRWWASLAAQFWLQRVCIDGGAVFAAEDGRCMAGVFGGTIFAAAQLSSPMVGVVGGTVLAAEGGRHMGGLVGSTVFAAEGWHRWRRSFRRRAWASLPAQFLPPRVGSVGGYHEILPANFMYFVFVP